jgi:hypothetical protein
VAVALVGLAREIDRVLEGVGEAEEAAVIAARFRKLVEPPFRVLDLGLRCEVDRRVVRDIDEVLADADQVAPQREVVDRPAVVFGVDDRCRFRCQAREILRRRQPGDVRVRRQKGLQGHRRRDLAGADQPGRDFEDLLVDRFKEVPRLEEVRHPVEGLVVDQDRAKQRLFRLDVVRGLAIIRLRLVG